MPVLDINQPEEKPVEKQPEVEQKSVNVVNPPPGYEWSDRWKSREKINISPTIKLNTAGTQYRPEDDTPGQYPNQGYEQQVNYDKLTGGEKALPQWLAQGRQLKEKLPAWTYENPVSRAVGYVGKGALSVLGAIFEPLAEGAERGLGVAAQAIEAKADGTWDDFSDDLKSSWYAGSAAYDTMNLFRFTDTDGNFDIHTPKDMPGVDGMENIRRDIEGLVTQGYSYKEAMEASKEKYYNSVGALAIRAQLNDTIGHIAIDPADWLLMAINPVSVIKSAADVAGATKYAPELLDSWKLLAKTAEKFEDVEDVARIAEKFPKFAGKIENVEDAGKLAEHIRGIVDHIIKTKKPIKPMDKLAMFLSGKMPEPIGDAKKFEKFLYQIGNKYAVADSDVGKFIQKINPFSLSPEARAYEMRNRVSHFISTNVVGSGSPELQVSRIKQLMQGSISGDMAYLSVTPDGRMAQAALSMMDIEASTLLRDFRALQNDGLLVRAIADMLKMKTPTVIDEFKSGKAASLLSRLAETSDTGAAIVSNISDDVITRIGKLAGKPYTEELFGLALRNKVIEASSQMFALKYGVSARGYLHKTAGLIKAAETMAFLRLNPTYMVKNFVNNEITLIADDLGFWKKGLDIAKDLGFKPSGYEDAFTMAALDDLAGEGIIVGDAIREALEGDITWLDTLRKKINSADIPLDMGRISSKIEKSASRRAMNRAYMQGMKKYVRDGKYVTPAVQYFSRQAASELGEETIQALQRSLSNVNSKEDIANILDDLDNFDFSRNANNAIRNAEQALGVDLDDVLGDKTESVRNALQSILDSGKTPEEMARGTRTFFDELHKEMIKEIESKMDFELGEIQAHYENLTELMGPSAFPHAMGDLSDDMVSAEISYGMAMERFNPELMSPEVRKIKWPQWLAEQEAYYARTWKRIDSKITGFRNGARNAGLKVPDEVFDGFRVLKNSRKSFFKKRNKMYENFFDALERGVQPKLSWDDIVDRSSSMYDDLVAEELDLFKEMDDLLGTYVRHQGDEAANAYLAWRQQARDIRKQIRETVKNHMNAIRSGEVNKSEAYLSMWKEKKALLEQLNSTERASWLAMSGKQADNIPPLQTPGVGGLAPEDMLPTQMSMPFAEDLIGKTPHPYDLNKGLDDQWQMRGFDAFNEIEMQMLKQIDEPARFVKGVSDETAGEIRSYLNLAQNQLGEAKYASLLYARSRRDAALLNYRHTYNYDNWLSLIMPYEFWMTHSMMRWATRAIDRPAMMALYYRSRELQDNIMLKDNSFPTRLNGMLRIKMPFMEDYLGDSVYFDPLGSLLPFDQLTMPYQRTHQDAMSFQSRVQRELERMASEGKITREEMEQALATGEGDAFGQAYSNAQYTEGSGTDGFDVISMMSSPHAPITWAYKALTDKKEEIGPFLPLTYTVARVLGAMGIDYAHTKAAKMNPGAMIRRAYGGPAFDQWEDYRVDRMVTNMIGSGEYDINSPEVRLAMTNRQGPVWEEARRRSAKEYAGGGWFGALIKTLGGRIGLYPVGEQELRQLSDDATRAWEAYESGDEMALENFYLAHPEYEARSALWDTPEERQQNFLIGDIWETYMGMPTVQKRAVRDALGEDFQNMFLDKELRNPEGVPLDTLQYWRKMMGGEPGRLDTDPIPIDMASDDIAYQAEIFYSTRNMQYPNYYELQDKYFDLVEGQARKEFLQMYPELKMYWDWRRDFLKRNPSIAPYIDDEFEPKYSSIAELEQAYAEEPQFTEEEYSRYLGTYEVNIIKNIYDTGFIPPQDIVEYLETKANELGLSYSELIEKVGGAE